MFPVEEKIESIDRALSAGRNVVLTAPPGSGKTTCVPLALLSSAWLNGKRIILLEPRRLAARNCAAYMARKQGEPLGETVGYQVRLERKITARTRLEVLTEGLLTQRLLSDPELTDVGLVIFDEFHERSLACDLSFALALEVQRALRPDLRLMVMSATLDTDEVSRHIDGTVIRAEGRMYPVETRYVGPIPLAAAVERALAETTGDILCFLPGEGEIRRNLRPGWLPLYGALSKEDQDRVFQRSSTRKVILATSIAETSITLEGVTAVIDSGLMRVPRFSPVTGMTGLVTLPLTRDRAEQRRGRAGRVCAGVCYRLWSEQEDTSRPQKAMPEILDADLCGLVLTSAAWGAVRRLDLPWLTPPPDSAWEQAAGLLRTLGALDAEGRLTRRGQKMAQMPMHPRLAAMLLAGGSALMAAIIEEGCRSRETDVRYIPQTPRMQQLARQFARFEHPGRTLETGAALACAYPDRIARNRGNGTFRMTSGRGAFLPENDPLASEPFIVCCELDDRVGDAKIFLAAPVTRTALDALFGAEMHDETEAAWDNRVEVVRCVRRRMLGALALDERTFVPEIGDERVARALLAGIRQKGVANLPCWTKESLQLRARVDFVARHCPDWPTLTDERLLAALPGFIVGIFKWRDLERIDLIRVIDTILAEVGQNRRSLDRLAPTKMTVPSGSHMTIHYEGDEPTVAVRLQECFGLMTTPRVVSGKVPVVMTLLSPAHRPVQVTKDLEGFWRGAYQLVRKDMRGRYPKHYWPEDPLTAVATARVRPR